jgi:hypothetical protein
MIDYLCNLTDHRHSQNYSSEEITTTIGSKVNHQECSEKRTRRRSEKMSNKIGATTFPLPHKLRHKSQTFAS